jgi:phenylalanyl-tRNA synthetase beta chain
MKISYNWLKEFAAITLAPEHLAEKMTKIGFAVDSVERAGDDYIFDFDITSNRPDALSHIGIAREAALVCGVNLRLPEVKLNEAEETTDSAVSCEILDAALCPRYAARVVRGVKVGPSPKWLAGRLEALGQRPVNNIADISNYVMFEMGQPTHAFDLGKLHGRKIIVRRAVAGELITTLDGLTRELSPEMLVIADSARPVALAGIMGGEDTEISYATRDVLIESAYFNPVSIRRTSRQLGLDTEASHRFSRGADYQAQVWAADRVAGLIAEIAGGCVLRGVIDIYPAPIKPTAVRLRQERIARVSGLEVKIEEAAEVLRALEFDVELLKERKELIAIAPSFRVDISREEDLIEEVVRHKGYDLIELRLPAWTGAGSYLAGEERRRKLRQTLASLGFDEAISLSFVRAERDRLFGGNDKSAVSIINPLDANESQMRTSLLTCLVTALERNFDHGCRDVKLFEMGKRFSAAGPSSRPIERESLALVMTGSIAPLNWRDNRKIDFYDLKGAVEAILCAMNISGFTFERASVEYLHPGQSAALVRDGQQLALLGRLHPRLASLLKFRQPVFVAELDLEALLELPSERARYSALPRLPSTYRDISAVLPEEVSWSQIQQAIMELAIQQIVSVKVFDVYKGQGVPERMRSLSFRTVYRSQDRTLTDEEVNAIDRRIRQMLEHRFGAQLR